MICDGNGGVKCKTEDIWKTVLKTVKYTEWDGEEVKLTVEEVAADVNDENISEKMEDQCDGIILTNIDENATEVVSKIFLLKGWKKKKLKESGITLLETRKAD